MASDKLKIPANLLHTEKEFSRQNEVSLNFLASDIFYVPANFLRNEKI